MKKILVLCTAVMMSFMTVFTAVAQDIKTYSMVPPGFQEYIVTKGDTWATLLPDTDDELLAMRVNRVDRTHLRVGMKVLLPVSSVAHEYTPVPASVAAPGRQLVVFLKEQYFGAYENGVLVHWGPVSSGKSGRRTPTGVFRAIWKDRWHRSSLYNNAKMYFAVQFYGNYFTHESPLPGYPASHGCVRMLAEDAAWKFAWIEKNDTMRVIPSTEDI